MGLLRHRGEASHPHRYQMRQKLHAIGDDYWFEDAEGDHIYKVNGKAMRVRETFLIEDLDGRELVKIQEKKLTIRDKMEIERGDHTLATIHKAMVGVRDRFDIDVKGGDDLKARGNITDHEYEIKRDGDVIATVSKKWFRMRDSYGIEIRPGEDEPLILAVTVAIDSMSHRV